MNNRKIKPKRNNMSTMPKDWRGTEKQWRETVTLEYVCSQGYDEPDDAERLMELRKIGWKTKSKKKK